MKERDHRSMSNKAAMLLHSQHGHVYYAMGEVGEHTYTICRVLFSRPHTTIMMSRKLCDETVVLVKQKGFLLKEQTDICIFVRSVAIFGPLNLFVT